MYLVHHTHKQNVRKTVLILIISPSRMAEINKDFCCCCLIVGYHGAFLFVFDGLDVDL